MGRRKKEPAEVHRRKIGEAAERLFRAKGIEGVSMDEIAREAGYSKATLYVYFKNKEEIVGALILESMKLLSGYLSAALEAPGDTKERYDRICRGLLRYQEEYPFYFHAVLGRINLDFQWDQMPAEEKETFRTGEEINEKMKRFLESGIQAGEIRRDIEVMPVIFTFWGMLSGLIQMGASKEAYLTGYLGLDKEAFLNYGFDTLYRSIANTCWHKEELE